MNAAWIFGKRKFGSDPLNPDANKKIPIDRSESSLSKRESPEALAKWLMQYDIISFDVFDTLIFRPFSKPTDLFFLLSEKLNYLDLERIRKEMEEKAREQKWKEKGHREVTLDEIWEVIERECGIDRNIGMQLEIETELEMCFANPYMLKVFHYLRGCGKKIIAVSDMYLPADVIRRIVANCGFEGIGKYFVSCEYKVSKWEGKLYQIVSEHMGKDKKYIHVGDSLRSDVTKAKENGWHTEYYRNVNEVGMPYRSEDMSVMTGSVYRGVVNAHIHNGLYEYTKEYELGFIYGGIFVLGYCQFIHEYVRTHDIDKILFLSRDGDILNQVYTMLYPEESGEGKTEYVYWSRLAATKMGAGYYKYDYFRRFLYHKVNQGYTLLAVFTTMELEDMLEGCVEHLNGKKIGTKYYYSGSLLTGEIVDIIKEYLTKRWEEVLEHYKEQLEAGRIYYSKVLKGCKKVGAVDVGWAGSGAVVLDYIVNQIWGIKCEIIGLLAGMNTVYSSEPDMSEAQLQSGSLVSYLFSQENNRDLWKIHNPARGDNLLVEKILSSSAGSFRGFRLKGNSFRIILSDPREDNHELQKGILKFVEILLRYKAYTISGRDAYMPIGLYINTMGSDNYDEINIE